MLATWRHVPALCPYPRKKFAKIKASLNVAFKRPSVVMVACAKKGAKGVKDMFAVRHPPPEWPWARAETLV